MKAFLVAILISRSLAKKDFHRSDFLSANCFPIEKEQFRCEWDNGDYCLLDAKASEDSPPDCYEGGREPLSAAAVVAVVVLPIALAAIVGALCYCYIR